MRKIQLLLLIVSTLAFYSCERKLASDIKEEANTILQDGRWELYKQQIDTTDGAKFVDTSTVNHILTFNPDGETGTNNVFFTETNENRTVNFRYELVYEERYDYLELRLARVGIGFEITGIYNVISIDEDEMVLFKDWNRSGNTFITTVRYFRKIN